MGPPCGGFACRCVCRTFEPSLPQRSPPRPPRRGVPQDLAILASRNMCLTFSGSHPRSHRVWQTTSLAPPRKWPAFAECLRFRGATDWKRIFRDTWHGRCEMMLEVLDREKKLGFKMAAMPAMVRVDAPSRSYVATYPSAAQVGRGAWAFSLGASHATDQRLLLLAVLFGVSSRGTLLARQVSPPPFSVSMSRLLRSKASWVFLCGPYLPWG